VATTNRTRGQWNALQRNVVPRPKPSPAKIKLKASARDRTGLTCLSLLLRAPHNIIPPAQNIPQNAADIQSPAVPMSFSIATKPGSIYYNSIAYPINYVGIGKSHFISNAVHSWL
jgi:hypothetical protein